MANNSSTGGYLAPTSALAPEDDAFDNIMQELVVGVTALPTNLVRPRWQPVPPAQPEATVNWCAIGITEESPQSGRPAITHDSAASGGIGADTLQVNDEAEIMASFYGPNSGQFAKLLRDGIMLPQNRESLELQGFRLVGMPSATRQVPELVNQVFIGRFDLTFRIKRASITVWPIENIASLQVELITDRFIETGESTLP
jgi:hypothetical protein